MVAKESVTVIDSMGVYSMKHEAEKEDTVLSRDGLLWQWCYLSAVFLSTHFIQAAHTQNQMYTHAGEVDKHTPSINLQTQLLSSEEVIPLSGAGITFGVTSHPGPEFGSQSFMWAQEWEGEERRKRLISLLFVSAVCMVCRFELNKVCEAFGCGATDTIVREGKIGVRHCERGTHRVA